jgi:hypothetical protein
MQAAFEDCTKHYEAPPGVGHSVPAEVSLREEVPNRQEANHPVGPSPVLRSSQSTTLWNPPLLPEPTLPMTISPFTPGASCC